MYNGFYFVSLRLKKLYSFIVVKLLSFVILKLYTFIIYLIKGLLPLVGCFNKKIRLFVNGRKVVWDRLASGLVPNERYVWVHTASLGEFEQGLPVIKALRGQGYRILVTFFSPSGYEVRKNSQDADLIVYLPLDTPANAKRFVETVRPVMAIFVKYEFWLHYLHTLKGASVPTYLLSGIFRPEQAFFKWYGGVMREGLRCFTHFFVQNEASAVLLSGLGFKNVMVSGDTRFDRVYEILQRDNRLDFVVHFKGDRLCVVFGSSWALDEAIYANFINQCENVKFIIAPHNIHADEIAALRDKLNKKIVLYSEKDTADLATAEVLIVDTVGLLTKIYSYADVAYVGGGMGTQGLHNVLEPAVFGIPVVIGKNYEKFNEARELVGLGGVISVASAEAFEKVMGELVTNAEKREVIGAINRKYIGQKKGATAAFMAAVAR